MAWLSHGLLQQRNLMRSRAISLDVDCKCVNYMITAFGYDPLTNDQIQVKCAIKCAFSSSCMNGCLLCTTLLFDRLSQFFVFLSLIFYHNHKLIVCSTRDRDNGIIYAIPCWNVKHHKNVTIPK